MEALEWKDLRQCRSQLLVPCAKGGGLRDSSLSENLLIFLHGLVLHDTIDFIPKCSLRNSNSRVKPNSLILSQIDLISVGIQEYRSVN